MSRPPRRGAGTWLRDQLPLEIELALAGYRRGELLVPILTAIALALAVALAAALEMSLRTVDEAIARSARSLAGRASIEVLAGGMQLREELIQEIRSNPGVEDAQGILIRAFRLTEAPFAGDSIHVIALDLARATPIHGYEIESHEMVVGDPLKMLALPGSVVISEKLAQRLNLKLGDDLPVTSRLGSHRLTVQGVIRGPLSEAFSGLLAVMDIYSLQDLIGRVGWVDRIDVVTREDSSTDEVLAGLEAQLAGRAEVTRATSHVSWARDFLERLGTALRVLAGVGAAVALLVAYGCTRRRAERRLHEFAILRVSGLSGRAVVRVFLIDAFIIGLAGSALGFLLAIQVGPVVTAGVRNLPTVADHVEPAETTATGFTLLVSLGAGLALAAIGSAAPTFKLSRMPPLGAPPSVYRAELRFRTLALLSMLALAVIGLVASPSLPGLEIARVGLVLLAIGAISAASLRLALPIVVSILRPLTEKAIPRIGSLVGSNLLARPTEVSVVSTMISIVLGASLATVITVASAIRSVTTMVEQRLDGCVYVRAGPPSGSTEALLSLSTIELIRGLEGVRAAATFYASDIVFEGREVNLTVVDLAATEARARLQAIGRAPEALSEDLLSGQIAVTGGFLRAFEKGVGDLVELPTDGGYRSFTIAGVVNAFGSSSGVIYMEDSVARRHWPIEGATSMCLWPSASAEALAMRVNETIRDREVAHVYLGDEFVARVKRTLDGFTSVLWLVGLMIGVFGGVAILATLTGVVIDRQDENSLLMIIGLTRGDVTAAVALDALAATGLGVVLGSGVGALVAPLFADALQRVGGWNFDLAVHPMDLAMMVALAFLAAALSCLYPALAAGVLKLRVPAPD